MRIYYDCEFLENGSTIDLISIGMVAADGRELYCVSEEIGQEPLDERIGRDRWLMRHVVPHLPLRPDAKITLPEAQHPGRFHLDLSDNRIMPRRMIRNAVREFILATPDVELWAWYSAYDHVALAQLFGRMIHLPDGVPMYTRDLRQEYDRLGAPAGLPDQPDGEHNALADARHVRVRAEWLASLP